MPMNGKLGSRGQCGSFKKHKTQQEVLQSKWWPVFIWIDGSRIVEKINSELTTYLPEDLANLRRIHII